MGRGDVVAAGAVVVRKGGEVLLVHRPKYDDWAFPKGKQDKGEHVTATAVREMLEETGLRIRLGRPLPPQLYAVSGSRMKTVHYWVGRPIEDDDVAGYAANDEIDEVAWFGREKARRRLTYVDDRELLARLADAPVRTRALVVLRHAESLPRKAWSGADGDRPLDDAGRVQAGRLVPLLAAYGVARVVSSDSLRCTDTVLPYAGSAGLPVEEHASLDEEAWTPAAVGGVVDDLLAVKEDAVLCTHRPVPPAVLAHLGVEEEPLAKGECVVVHHRKGSVVAVERHLVR